MYGVSAVLLQYTLTLNCLTFSLQAAFLIIAVILQANRKNLKKAVKRYYPLIIVSTALSILYVAFLVILIPTNKYVVSDTINATYWASVLNNAKVLFDDICLVDSWAKYAILASLLYGVFRGSHRKKYITLYWLLLFIGQLLFSTFMTYSRIWWFAPRYIVASYVAFAVLCALGFELFFHKTNQKVTIALVLLLLLTPLYSSVSSYIQSLNTKTVNPTVAAIEAGRCKQIPTVVLCNPNWICEEPRYEFHEYPMVSVPERMWENRQIKRTISRAASENKCFNVIHFSKSLVDKDKIIRILMKLPGYRQRKIKVEPGRHMDGYVWQFVPE